MKKYIVLFVISFFLIQVFADEKNVYPLDSSYHNQKSMRDSIEYMVSSNPEIATWKILGSSTTNKLPIYAVKVSDNVGVDEYEEPAVLIVGQHQSEEPVGVEIGFDILSFLINNYDSSRTGYLVDNFEFWFIPTLNPEGYVYVNSEK